MKQNELNTLAQKINQQLMIGATDTARLVIDSNANLSSALGQKLDAIQSALKGLQPKPPVPASRLCRDCKHCRPKTRVKVYRVFLPDVMETSYEYAICARPNSPDVEFLVNGEGHGGYLCSTERKGDWSLLCQAEGRFWEPK